MFGTFGNKVKIKKSEVTIEKGLDGKTGVIYGTTTPSMMDFEIVGTPEDDFAVNVYFEDLKESFWFAAELLEQIDDGNGTVITLDGVDKKWTKGKNGVWLEENTSSTKKILTRPILFAIIIPIIGSLFLISHYPYGKELTAAGFFIIMVLYLIRFLKKKSKKVKDYFKLSLVSFWSIGVIFNLYHFPLSDTISWFIAISLIGWLFLEVKDYIEKYRNRR